MEARIHRIAAGAPDDVSGIEAQFAAGRIDPRRIVAILGKTEGNGCVNDFTRGFASSALKAMIVRATGEASDAVERRVVTVMSGGTEGGLSPHWLVFEVVPGEAAADGEMALAIGTAVTRPFAPHEIGRAAQIDATADAVREAMAAAGIERAEDVHYVQVKCPLLTKSRIAEARADGRDVATEDTLKSMAYSRGASALGVGVALGELSREAIDDAVVCRDFSLYSNRASTSAGVELLENQILVVGNSRAWSGEYRVAHDVMQDAIDSAAVIRALSAAGIASLYPLDAESQQALCAVLCKAEASQTGLIRGARHTMLDDSDIASSRHARALVGGVIAGVVGTTLLFVSGGAEHQGPDGGGPVAVIVRKSR
ncbi:ring-opening amidohydrolase [Tardiphaga sp. vice304]|uniref:cyanuric acid amidohydrolase n=1 Tax=unclassified Tardiphaga TaxID=2631404 RepID=UPI001162D522|nr:MULTISPECIES: ring-opening amidohydrolase [unclassified Tardiphaga]QDM16721.1 ring-opening amidohydrolase [Tardiphaga sp. vice278]QDM21744.1 ring-opening amidohydrolase [Tardiphaga sp. vice154]QDM26926.1 ring-opening amidohydrolase [Tardiphaga sp. vice304]